MRPSPKLGSANRWSWRSSPEPSTEYADGILQEGNDRGIVLSMNIHVGPPAQSLFYPWSAHIQLSEEQDG